MKDSHAYIPGFDGLKNDALLPKVVTRYLTKALSSYNKHSMILGYWTNDWQPSQSY